MLTLKSGLNALIGGLLFSLCASLTCLAAEPWPRGPVRIIVPIAAGSGSDVAARQFAERLADHWKQPVVVENRPGADGLVGTIAFTALRDDHVLFFSPAAPISVFPLTHERLPYDPARDLVPIASATNTFVMLAAAEAVKVQSLQELVTLARSRPGTLNWSSGGGALTYLLAGFVNSAKLDMVAVSYRDQNAALQDLAAGRIHVMMTVLAALLPHVSSGKITLLAATNRERAPLVPNVPTVMELGYPELAFEGLWGFFGPRDMPVGLRNRIAADIRSVAADPDLTRRLAAIGQITHAGTSGEFLAEIEAQRDRIASTVKLTGTAFGETKK
jgi:tripartite-type tricarboxylate transporter receptor subunit TctC